MVTARRRGVAYLIGWFGGLDNVRTHTCWECITAMCLEIAVTDLVEAHMHTTPSYTLDKMTSVVCCFQATGVDPIHPDDYWQVLMWEGVAAASITYMFTCFVDQLQLFSCE